VPEQQHCSSAAQALQSAVAPQTYAVASCTLPAAPRTFWPGWQQRLARRGRLFKRHLHQPLRQLSILPHHRLQPLQGGLVLPRQLSVLRCECLRVGQAGGVGSRLQGRAGAGGRRV
jgi:hypothetical protein